MYQRIISVVVAALFTLIAVVSSVMTDLHDRSYPHALAASSTLYLDFAPTGMSDRAAFDELRAISDRSDLGLVRILPDLAGDADGQVFVPLGSAGRRLPSRVPWYGDQPTGAVGAPGALAHSFATGQYLVTRSRDGLDAAVDRLVADGVKVRRVDDTVGQSASFLVRQESIRTTMLAAAALMMSVALFWLSVRSRGRALRVLGGVSSARIQAEDLGRLAVAVALPGIPVTAVAVVLVAARHGTAWLGYYATTLVGLELGVVAVTIGCALVMSLASWPSVRMLATRQPAVRSLRKAAGFLKVASFVLVVLTAGPAWWAYQDAHAAAVQEARWRALSDQVALRYPAGLGEAGFVRVTNQVGRVVADADAAGAAALSYAMDPGQLGVEGGGYDSVVLVNPTWLTLMGLPLDSAAGHRDLRRVPHDAVPANVVAGLRPNLDIWARAPLTGSKAWDSFDLLTTREGATVPMASGGNGDLVFPHHPLLVVVAAPAATFNGDFLASLTSSNNVVLAGLDATTALLREHGLSHTLQIKYAAEDGVLRAQFAAYEAWLRGFALLTLGAAFALALAISASITALLHARRDFPLRLDGRTWPAILRPRVGQEWALGLVLGGLVLLAQSSGTWAATALAVALGLAGTAVAHLWAARWTFRQLSSRNL